MIRSVAQTPPWSQMHPLCIASENESIETEAEAEAEFTERQRVHACENIKVESRDANNGA